MGLFSDFQLEFHLIFRLIGNKPTDQMKLGPDGKLIGLLLFALALIVNARHRLQVARRQYWNEEEEGSADEDNDQVQPEAPQTL